MADPSAVWDPDPLAVGDEVLVRRFGECEWWPHTGALAGFEGTRGVVATVLGRPAEAEAVPGAQGHVYMVRFASPLLLRELVPPYRWTEVVQGVFARAELERLG